MKILTLPPDLIDRWSRLSRGPDVRFMAVVIALSLGVLGYFIHTLQSAMQRGPWQPDTQWSARQPASVVPAPALKLAAAEETQARRSAR